MTDINPIPFLDSRYVIYDGKYWNVILNRDHQAYLGYCIIFLKSRVLEDLLQLTEDERNELWNDILPRLKNALDKAFQPDRLNYAHLANKEHFVHWHIVPRYEKNPVREFAGQTFTDERTGSNYAPVPDKPYDHETKEQIYLEIKKYF